MRRLALAAPGALLLAYYALLWWMIYHPPPIVTAADSAGNESGPVYGFWSGFGGTLIFSALVLFPPWYYRHSCHESIACLRWGAHPDASGLFRYCRHHHPDLAGHELTRAFRHRLHHEAKERR